MVDVPTRISDLLVADAWNSYTLQLTTQLSRFRRSGIVADLSAELENQMNGVSVHMPFFQDLGGSDEVVDDTQDLTISSMTTSQDFAVKLYRAKVFGASDLAADLSKTDPMAAIATRFADWWVRAEQTILLSVCTGAMGSMAAESGSPNVLDITGLSGAAANFDPHSFIDAQSKLGDHQDLLSGVAVHSMVYTAMKKMDLIDFIKPSEAEDAIPTYMGKVLIVDDGMPYNSGTGVFSTYIFGPGAIGYVSSNPRHPVDAWRDPLKNGGQEYIVQRRHICMHPRGIRWNPANGVPVKQTPSNAELSDAGNWSRVYDPKNIRIVLFKHKIG
ncbi:hypothetical protein [Hyphomicrobium sp.]|uniref:hypothetical protein n=1 Tax=Hyphomicrobium sp. TaxID=82 RepID=UPI001D7C919B|nr:hypothetical protein [Hyphomicrobium sp.]MBY0559860.1 coat protein [Hyphomicrobium sp.]